jgi:hypothetical protein
MRKLLTGIHIALLLLFAIYAALDLMLTCPR